MSETKAINHKQERDNDVNKILISTHPRKIVVAGPGTGKSYLFEQAIEKKKEEGKNRFLAITFIGKLCDILADDLASLAETMTLHGFARKFVLDQYPKGWEYYPKIADIIREDLRIKGVVKFKTGDTNYEERTKYYRAVGEEDVVHYAVQICKKDTSKVPQYDLILIDEFQDFNETEAELIDLLATKNEILIVGDDDQALYQFKGSFSKFIRDKYDKSNTDFESHTLRYCSRCTEVIINAFHNIVEHFCSEGKLSGRIKKEYVCYPPDKKKDSDLNPEILLFENIAPGLIPTKIRYELSSIIREQKIKSVLIIGEGRTCEKLLLSIAKGLKEFGFKGVNHAGHHHRVFFSKSHVIMGYKILSEESNDILAWRLLLKEIDNEAKIKKIISENYANPDGFMETLPSDFKKLQKENAKILKRILEKPESGRNQIAWSSIEKLLKQVVIEEREKRDIFINQLIDENKYLPRLLANIDITVCNILGSKGLGADVVFLVGFDQGKLPMKKNIEDSEVYQMLVALTRANKRIYFINTIGRRISRFIDYIDESFIKKV